MITAIRQSMLGAFIRCGAQFEYRYVKGISLPPGIAARVGSGTHAAAEKNHQQKIETGADLPVDELTEAARDKYVQLVTEHGVHILKEDAPDKSEKAKLIGHGLDRTVQATEIYHADLAPDIKPSHCEIELTADIGIDLPLSGIFDVIERGNGGGRIRDLKTTGRRKNQRTVDRDLQATIYSTIYKKEFGAWPDDFTFDYVVTSKTMKSDRLVTKRGDEDFRRLLRYLEMFIKAINKGVFPPADPDAWICSPKFCGYYNGGTFRGMRIPKCPYAGR